MLKKLCLPTLIVIVALLSSKPARAIDLECDFPRPILYRNGDIHLHAGRYLVNLFYPFVKGGLGDYLDGVFDNEICRQYVTEDAYTFTFGTQCKGHKFDDKYGYTISRLSGQITYDNPEYNVHGEGLCRVVNPHKVF